MPASRYLHNGEAKIDAHNRKLLQLLADEGREPATSLAKELRLSREVVSYRMKRLEEEGAIQGYTIRLNYKGLGLRQYRVFMLLDERHKADHNALIKFIVNHPNTYYAVRYSDTWDLGWSLLCKDLDEFDRVLTELETHFSQVIIEYDKFAIIDTYASNMLPVTQRPNKPQSLIEGVQLDDTDRKLLVLLSQNSRASTYELGSKIGMSSDGVIVRMRKLRENGFILGYTPIINIAAIGMQWYTYVIQFSRFTQADEKKFASYVAAHPYILRAVKLFGGKWDVMLEIAVDSQDKYHATAKEIKNVFAEIIQRYEAWIVHEEILYQSLPPMLEYKEKK